jgi:hypothetical protein
MMPERSSRAEQETLPEWESLLIDEAITAAERRYADEQARAKNREVELRRQQAYHRLALEIDRPEPTPVDLPGQLRLFPSEPTLFDED